jgi:hypothetical protein
MTISYRILNIGGINHIEFNGRTYSFDDLQELLLILGLKLMYSLPPQERTEVWEQFQQILRLRDALKKTILI